MEKGYRLRIVEQRCGDLHTVIPKLVNEIGQSETARLLGVSQFTVNRWLKKHHYKPKIVYIKCEETGETT